ncbi:uncharacterized protein LOC119175907 isoform X1 [Rhipicephalus microplus]|uniref:uncharacterized protein LOC119175907 isoform X1 n=2 Tax=Rhipicephalus microplus TaxID=6941 RepID=UPI003F6A8DCD
MAVASVASSSFGHGRSAYLLARERMEAKGAPFSRCIEAEGMTASPPCLPPVSGVLLTKNPALVRPVAVYWNHGQDLDDGCSSRGSVFNLYNERMLMAPDQPTGHHSAPPMRSLKGKSVAVVTRTCTAFHPARCKSSFFRSMPHIVKIEDPPRSPSSSDGGSAVLDVLDSGHSSAILNVEEEAPSPSDSGVAELEAQLREKDAEIMYLRQTMERNENAIIQVYEEKEQNWTKEMDDVCDYYENIIRRNGLSEAACMTPAAPGAQVQQKATAFFPKRLDNSPVFSGSRLEEASCRPGGAIKLSWLETPQLDSEVAELTSLMERTRIAGSTEEEARRLRVELHRCRRQLQLALQGFEQERQQWQEERERAAKYQRQLETDYWQLFSQNRELLRAVSHTSLPLELLDGWYHSESSC